MENYLIANGKRIDLTSEEVRQLKEKLGLPLSYEDICMEMDPDRIADWFAINEFGDVVPIEEMTLPTSNIAMSEAQLEQILALNKLFTIAKCLNKNWEPRLDSQQYKYKLTFQPNKKQRSGEKWYGGLHASKILTQFESTPYFRTKQLAYQAVDILGIEETLKAMGVNNG